MDLASWLVWGFAATVVLTGIMTAAQAMGLTRIDIPFILGTMITPDRDLARVLGIAAHLLNGLIFALVYAAAIDTTDIAGWFLGPLIGLVHGSFVVLVATPAIPGIHPRMASATWGPEPTRALEPPGPLALNYGRGTPVITVLAHVMYGAVFGIFY